MESSREQVVTTTRPIIPPYSKHPTIITKHPHVILRPFKARDLDALHELRTQIDVMQWTSTAKVDADMDQTKTWLKRFMEVEEALHQISGDNAPAKVKVASNSSTRFNFAIVYRYQPHAGGTIDDASEKLIGAGGCHILDPEPEVGYMIRKEYWGKGIATAVVDAFLNAYWKLERETVTLSQTSIKDFSRRVIRTKDDTIDMDTSLEVREVITAVIVAANIGSRRVLEKCGFQYRWNETIEENGGLIALEFWTLDRP